MSLRLSARVEARDFDVELEVADAERVAVLGPNGAGKSTLLALLAGVLRPDSGRADIDGRVLFDFGSPKKRWVPPHDRGVSLLAQDPLLFPHLSVLDNVAFGPRSSGRSVAQSRMTAQRWLAEVDVAEFAEDPPTRLSGGQAQRVAIARALAADPGLLLLDEPMAALDVAVTPLLRRVLRRVLLNRTAIIATHDILDALLLADRVIVLDRGRIVEDGAADEVLRYPRTPFTARLAGLNIVRGSATGAGLREPGGHIIEGAPRADLAEGDPAVAVFSPTAVSIFAEPPHGSPRNTIPVMITEFEPRGGLVRVRADDRHGHTLTADVTLAAVADLDLRVGQEALYTVKATSVTLYPG